MEAMVYDDCRHYARRSTAGGDVIERCRLGLVDADKVPYECVPDCLFREPRTITDAGWQTGQ
jgi:hypothetical protein